jgi:hypothetical protein
MAVTRIRKISSWILIAISVISVAFLALFYFGGEGEPYKDNPNPIYTGELLYWAYFLLAFGAFSLLVFGLLQFFNKLKASPKSALLTLAVFAAFAVLLVVAYSIGDPTPLLGINADSQAFNTPFWLQVTDMWLYAIYILLGLAIVAMLCGSVKKAFSK